MIVPNAKVDLDELQSKLTSGESLIEYSDNLVGDIYKHNMILVYNQRYYLYHLLLNRCNISRKLIRKAKELLKDIRIAGSISEFIGIKEVEDLVDIDVVYSYLSKDM